MNSIDFKNEKSKIYLFIDIFEICVIIIYMICFFTNRDTLIGFKLFDIGLIIFGLYKLLIGTQRLIAQKNKRGYFDCLLAIFCLAVFIKHIF